MKATNKRLESAVAPRRSLVKTLAYISAAAIVLLLPLAPVMNRKVFDSLPEAAKTLVRDHSGVWLAERYIETSDVISQRVLKQLRADPRRTVTVPTPADLTVVQHAFEAVADDWAAKNSRNQNLLALVKSEIAKLRSSKETRP